jgi:glucose-1-phosphate thymidylyltransferase
MWGIIPAAGEGKRIQPLAFSKELLPVGVGRSAERTAPRAVSDFIVERMILGGATKLCLVISPLKSDIVRYHADGGGKAHVVYQVQPRPLGLCDAIFRPQPLIAENEEVLIGLPDTVWFPATGYQKLPSGVFSLLLFPVSEPERFDAVVLENRNRVKEVQVKTRNAKSKWIWGGMRLPGKIYQELACLWQRRGKSDEYLGTLINAWIKEGGRAYGVKAGRSYLDVGSVEGFYAACRRLRTPALAAPQELQDNEVPERS